jgi:hypothetical protein
MTALSSLLTDRTRHFTGREWVFKAVGAWISDDRGARVFLLTGGPGTGKTAVAARLAQMTLGDVPPGHPSLGRNAFAYCHFCQAGVESTLSPVTFVQSLSQALANRYPAFRDALLTAGSRQIAISVTQTFGTVQPGANVTGVQFDQVNIEIRGGDARPLFDEAVRRPLLAMSSTLPPSERIPILVDSLDEALGFSADGSIGHLLALANDFPAQVRFLLTSRSHSERVFDLVGPSTLDLLTNAPASLDEVRPSVWGRLAALPEPERSVAADRIASKSEGNFLYAYHVVNDLLTRGAAIADADTLDLPDALEGVYRKYLERELGSNRTRWNDVYRPILGPIAVARGDGLTKAQLIGITDLAEDTASDVLGVCAPYLVGGDPPSVPYRIFHQSFRDFLLADEKFTVYPAERHAAIARYLQERCGANWARCDDQYALRYTPAHWAEAAMLSPVKREARTHALLAVAADRKYQQRFESRVTDLPMLHSYLNRAVQVATLNDRDDMLPSIVKAAREYVRFRREYLRSDSVVALAEEGRLDQAEGRLPLFMDVNQDWLAAARLILAWLAAGRAHAPAVRLRDSVAKGLPATGALPLLLARLDAALAGQALFPVVADPPISLDLGRQLVNRIGGQAFDAELLASIDPSLMANQELQDQGGPPRGYVSASDAPALVSMARAYGTEGTTLVDEYVDAHAGYNYVEYRNKSMLYVLLAVLGKHDDQHWVKARLRRIVVTALSGGGVDFEEMLPVATYLLSERAHTRDVRSAFASLAAHALDAASALQHQRGANDVWGNHRRRLTALMELSYVLVGDRPGAQALLSHIQSLPQGFAGFLAPARLRQADALRACRLAGGGELERTLDDALRSAHHIQDYHFCARVTARCNALMRWHRTPLAGPDLSAAIERLARAANDGEFAADHLIHEPFRYRPDGADLLPLTNAREAATIGDLVEVFQRSAVEFRRLNPRYAMDEPLVGGTPIRVPDPGFGPLLAVHLGARALADDALADDRTSLLRMLVPVAAANPTALDTVLSYLIVAADLQDPDLVDEIAAETGPVVFADVTAPAAQIGPDAVMPA